MSEAEVGSSKKVAAPPAPNDDVASSDISQEVEIEEVKVLQSFLVAAAGGSSDDGPIPDDKKKRMREHERLVLLARQKYRKLLVDKFQKRKEEKADPNFHYDGEAELKNALLTKEYWKRREEMDRLDEMIKKNLRFDVDKEMQATENVEEIVNLDPNVDYAKIVETMESLRKIIRDHQDGTMETPELMEHADADDEEGYEEQQELERQNRRNLKMHRKNVGLANILLKIILTGGLYGDYDVHSRGMLKVRAMIEGILNGNYDFPRSSSFE